MKEEPSLPGKTPTIILVGNFAPDRQESMQRFAQMLSDGFTRKGLQHSLLSPLPRGSRLLGEYRHSGVPKWLGYLDKYLLFPRTLRKAIAAEAKRGPVVVHVCDHSNAMYARAAAKTGAPHLVTCHDLLAVRGAFGEDTDCPATPSGVRLQKWILRSLEGAQHVACDSSATREDLQRLLPRRAPERSSVIPIGLNYPYRELSRAEADHRLTAAGLDPTMDYILHVGSNLARKNKPAVLAAAARAGNAFNGQIVFAGPAIPADLHELAAQLGLTGRLREVEGPDNDLLEALYNRARALVFPSRWEGFGWPIIEAQACGCPVICGNQSSLPEVAGSGAILCGPDDEVALGRAVAALADPAQRETLRAAGRANVTRFEPTRMIDAYLALYARLASASLIS